MGLRRRLWDLQKENPFLAEPRGLGRTIWFGATIAVFGAGLIASSLDVVADPVLWASIGLGVTSAVYYTALERRRARRAARSVPPTTIAALAGLRERSVVRIRGRVRARGPARCTWRRTEVTLHAPGAVRFYFDVAEDFDVVDDSGHAARVDVSAAVLEAEVAGTRQRVETLEALLVEVPIPATRIASLATVVEIELCRYELAQDDMVDVVGTLSRQVDPSGAALGREPPMCLALTAGKRRVVIVPV